MKFIAVIVSLLLPATIFASALGSEEANELNNDVILSDNTTYPEAYENSNPNDHHLTGNLITMTEYSKKKLVSCIKLSEFIKITFSVTSLVVLFVLIEVVGQVGCPILEGLYGSLLVLGFLDVFVLPLQAKASEKLRAQLIDEQRFDYAKECSRIGFLGCVSLFWGFSQSVSVLDFGVVECKGQICTSEANKIYIKILLPILFIVGILRLLVSSFVIKAVCAIRF